MQGNLYMYFAAQLSDSPSWGHHLPVAAEGMCPLAYTPSVRWSETLGSPVAQYSHLESGHFALAHAVMLHEAKKELPRSRVQESKKLREEDELEKT